MWLVHLCCVIASFLVNMLFLNIKSGLFIIRLFFPAAPAHPALLADQAATRGGGGPAGWAPTRCATPREAGTTPRLRRSSGKGRLSPLAWGGRTPAEQGRRPLTPAGLRTSRGVGPGRKPAGPTRQGRSWRS
jgi:hypothetical protein